MKIDLTTEEKIFEAAREIFHKKGLAGARMQEIADRAGINKALLHYYFRSKDHLFDAVLTQTLNDFFPTLVSTWQKNLPFEVKVYSFTENYIDFLLKNPYVPSFIINLIHNNPDEIRNKFHIKELFVLDIIQKQLDEESAKGSIRKVDSVQFIINIISLCIFPFAAKPMISYLLELDDIRFRDIMEQRKILVAEVVLAWLRVG
jgi:TetR/AcrR family transcriptional regulator